MAPPDADGPAGFTTDWHGHGAGHQANNNPGDTAADRHNFGDAEAGGSGHFPTAGSTQDDFSEEAGLPLIAVDAGPDAAGFPEDAPEDVLDMLF
jgi:hypothetical protein